MNSATLIIDIDGTLLDSPPCIDGGYDAWERRILAEPCGPVPGAVDGVAALLERYSGALPVFLTARSPTLESATRRDVMAALGSELLYPYGIFSGPLYYHCAGTSRKRAKLAHILSWGPAIVVDDDATIANWIRAVDRFLLAPDCWCEQSLSPAKEGTA